MIEPDDILVERLIGAAIMPRLMSSFAARLGSSSPGSCWKPAIRIRPRICCKRRCSPPIARWANSARLASFAPGSLRIAQNLAIDAARRDARKKRTPTVVSLRQQEKRPDEAAEQAELRERLLAALRLAGGIPLAVDAAVLGRSRLRDDPATDGLDERLAAGLLHRGMKRLARKCKGME